MGAVIRLEAYPQPVLNVSHDGFRVNLATQHDREEWRVVLNLTPNEAAMLSVLLARTVADLDRQRESSQREYDAERVKRVENRK